MSLNKKQKKQLEVERKKLTHLHQLLNGAKQQMDDPQEVVRIQQEIAACESRIKKLLESEG